MITIVIMERKVTWLIFERRNCKADLLKQSCYKNQQALF